MALKVGGNSGRWGRHSSRWCYLDASEARVGDFAEISGYWWEVVEFFPGIGDQVRGERNGCEVTAMVVHVPRWRRAVVTGRTTPSGR